MKRKIPTPVRFATDAGRRIAKVELATGEEARLLADAFDALQKLGVSPFWNLNHTGTGFRYVCAQSSKLTNSRSRLVRIARVVAGAKAGQVVKYRDGDTLNLLPENLVLHSGRSFGRELAVFAS